MLNRECVLVLVGVHNFGVAVCLCQASARAVVGVDNLTFVHSVRAGNGVAACAGTASADVDTASIAMTVIIFFICLLFL